MAKKSSLKITCPYCNKSITLDEALTQPLKEEITSVLHKKHQLELNKIKSVLITKEKEVESLKESVDEQIADALKDGRKKIEQEAKKRAEASISKELKELKGQIEEKAEKLQKAEEVELKLLKEKKELKADLEEEREEIQKEAKRKAEESLSKEFKDLKEQINEKNQKLEQSEKEELKLRKEKRELEEAKKNFELEIQRTLDEERKKIQEETSKRIFEEHELKDKEKDKQMDDLKKQINEWKRKAEQGSQKLQGEILEQELEQILREQFSTDEIDPISSGINGADILQKVCSKTGKICGTILIESKNAKNWSNTWVSKLKKDQREAKADIGIIVTTVLPESVNTFDCQEGIVIVQFNHAIPVIMLLRNQLFEVARVKSFSMGKNEKMEMLYHYLTGTEFKQKVESIVEAFGQMYNELQKEKRVMTRIWSKREKQIEQAVHGIAGMYGGMQGILGSSLPEIKSLEMSNLLIPDSKDEEDNEEDTK